MLNLNRPSPPAAIAAPDPFRGGGPGGAACGYASFGKPVVGARFRAGQPARPDAR